MYISISHTTPVTHRDIRKGRKMEAILNFSEPLNVALLDRVVDVFYSGHGAEVSQSVTKVSR